MTDRERLIEILRKPIFPHELADPTEAVADYLISNGVVVRDKGEWISEVVKKEDWKGKKRDYYQPCSCSICHTGLATKTAFCPICGADMRGEQHEP